jgi:hypothetical protein
LARAAVIRSAPVAGDGVQRRVRGWVALACGLSLLAGLGAAWWAIRGGSRAAGVTVAIAGVGLVVARAFAVRGRDARARLFVSLADRAVDGVVLAAVAWASRGREPAASAGALVALGASFLAAYVRARGEALGYRIPEGIGTRAVQLAWLATVLAAGLARWGLLALGLWMLLVVGVRVSQVAKEERV